jgi:copper resistance protein B
MSRWRPAVVIGLLLLLVTPEAAGAQSLSGDVDKFEYRLDGSRHLLFDGSLSYGGETDGLNAKLVIGGSVDRKIDQIQGELAYSRAIGQGFNLEAGLRHEFRSQGHLSYAVVGFSGEPKAGLALESYALASRKGDLFGEFKLVYDQPLNDRLTVQPRFAFNLAAQDVLDQVIARGLVATELGIRLRYEMSRLVAPYIGISHERLLGRTARIARKAGEVSRSTHVVVGFSSAF